MEYEKILQECKARAEVYRKCDAIWNLTHEEQCYKAITELLTRAEKAEREKDAALKEVRDRFFCRRNRVCMAACSTCDDYGECYACVSCGMPDRCQLCERYYTKEQIEKIRSGEDIVNGNKNDCNNDFNV